MKQGFLCAPWVLVSWPRSVCSSALAPLLSAPPALTSIFWFCLLSLDPGKEDTGLGGEGNKTAVKKLLLLLFCLPLLFYSPLILISPLQGSSFSFSLAALANDVPEGQPYFYF